MAVGPSGLADEASTLEIKWDSFSYDSKSISNKYF